MSFLYVIVIQTKEFGGIMQNNSFTPMAIQRHRFWYQPKAHTYNFLLVTEYWKLTSYRSALKVIVDY